MKINTLKTVDLSLPSLLKTLLYLMSGTIAYVFHELNLDEKLLLYYMVAITLDFIFGVLEANVLFSEDPKTFPAPTSKKARYGLITKGVMLLIPILVGITCNIINLGKEVSILASSTILIPLALAEIYSIWGHIISILTRQKVEETDAVTMVITKLRKKIFDLIKKLGD
tara:strand:- start:9960 stop:10466 length:507 start_codon:yes stop_codon:yes gene_type:complete